MDFHRDLADADFAGNLLVEAAGHDKSHDFALALRQGIEAGTEQSYGIFLLALGAIPVETQLDRVQQILVAKRLCHELDRTAFHRPNRHRDIAVAGNENDRQA